MLLNMKDPLLPSPKKNQKHFFKPWFFIWLLQSFKLPQYQATDALDIEKKKDQGNESDFAISVHCNHFWL